MSFTIHTGVEEIMDNEFMDNDQLITDLTDRVEALMNRRAQREEQEEGRWNLEAHAAQEHFDRPDETLFRQEVLRQVEMSAEEDDPVKRHFFDIIMNQVKQIQARYPKRFLCGSVALMLYGVMDKRPGGDLDFVAYEKKIIPNEHLSLKCSSPYKHCLFLGSYVKKGEKIDGIRLQDLDQIIYWKKSYGRKKDKEDLEKYFSNQFIKKDEFEL